MITIICCIARLIIYITNTETDISIGTITPLIFLFVGIFFIIILWTIDKHNKPLTQRTVLDVNSFEEKNIENFKRKELFMFGMKLL